MFRRALRLRALPFRMPLVGGGVPLFEQSRFGWLCDCAAPPVGTEIRAFPEEANETRRDPLVAPEEQRLRLPDDRREWLLCFDVLTKLSFDVDRWPTLTFEADTDDALEPLIPEPTPLETLLYPDRPLRPRDRLPVAVPPVARRSNRVARLFALALLLLTPEMETPLRLLSRRLRVRLRLLAERDSPDMDMLEAPTEPGLGRGDTIADADAEADRRTGLGLLLLLGSFASLALLCASASTALSPAASDEVGR